MQELILELRVAIHAYYDLDAPIMSDKAYDAFIDALSSLEQSTGIILTNSPTQTVGGIAVDGLEKVMHSKPMLSCAKTKSTEEIQNFCNRSPAVVSWKLDGLTIVLRYTAADDHAILTDVITRGNGTEGERVFHNQQAFLNVPQQIPCSHDVEVCGECVI